MTSLETAKISSNQIPAGALEIITELQRVGHAAYLAGGSVRDLLLSRQPKDFDIATSATPSQVERIFPQTIPVGREFGILIVQIGGNQFEVATFRGERGHSDKRRPDSVYWTDAREDALRRDFTINAMFYDPIAQRIHDFTSGQLDLKAQIIRFVGEPSARVSEDHLRILRAVRLKNSLDFQYDPATYEAIRLTADTITGVSAERIRDELNRILTDPRRAQGVKELADVGLLAFLLPEVERLRGLPQPKEFHQEGDTFDHTLRALASLPPNAPSFLAWAVMLHDAGKAETLHLPIDKYDRIRFEGHAAAGGAIARRLGIRLKMSRLEVSTIAWLIEHHMHLVGIAEMREAKRREYLLDPRFRYLLDLHKADVLGTLPSDLSLYREVKEFYKKYLAEWKVEQRSGEPPPLLSGYDLQQEFGLKPGNQLGELLEKLREAQLERRIKTRDEALAFARQLIVIIRPQ